MMEIVHRYTKQEEAAFENIKTNQGEKSYTPKDNHTFYVRVHV